MIWVVHRKLPLLFVATLPLNGPALRRAVPDQILDQLVNPSRGRRNSRGVKRKLRSYPLKLCKPRLPQIPDLGISAQRSNEHDWRRRGSETPMVSVNCNLAQAKRSPSRAPGRSIVRAREKTLDSAPIAHRQPSLWVQICGVLGLIRPRSDRGSPP